MRLSFSQSRFRRAPLTAKCTLQLPEELAQAPEPTRKPSEAQKAAEGQYAGVHGAAAISKAGPPRGDLKFGGVSTRSVPDAMSLRQQLSAI